MRGYLLQQLIAWHHPPHFATIIPWRPSLGKTTSAAEKWLQDKENNDDVQQILRLR